MRTIVPTTTIIITINVGVIIIITIIIIVAKELHCIELIVMKISELGSFNGSRQIGPRTVGSWGPVVQGPTFRPEKLNNWANYPNPLLSSVCGLLHNDYDEWDDE